MLRIIITAMLMFIAVQSNDLGFSYIEQGHGLHPALAFSVATLCIIVILVMAIGTFMYQRNPQFKNAVIAFYEGDVE